MGANCDVIIIGAGPAGLAAAFELTSISSKSVLIIDGGQSIEERRCPSLESMCVDHAVCNVTHGSGGAGLYSDGKLCLDPKIGGDITRFYAQPETIEMMARVIDMLSIGVSRISLPVKSKEDIKSCADEFKKSGLGLKYYDVTRLGLAERLERVQNLERYLKSKGVEFIFNTRAKIIHSDSEKGYRIETTTGSYHCRHLVAAPGKIGANWFNEQCRWLGISSYNNPLYIGVRLEMPREVMSIVSKITDNPRISMGFDNGDFIKTHCLSVGGHVVIANYDGLSIVDGNYLENRESNNASVNLLMELNLPSAMIPYQFSERFIRQINAFGNNRPVVQTVRDLLDFSETSQESLKDLQIIPTLNDCKCGDLSTLYSYRFADRLLRFLGAVDHVMPGFAQPENLLYAPFVEWWMRKVEVNRFFETSRQNLYAVGDGAGLSQGIIASAMQGIACARGIESKHILH
ncbi:MAG: FAD-binding protein [Candidatus Woesearchaeota archaeon]|nr:FAD-binding protein [Candidatus Woesearchaeota archaeon]